MLRLVGGSWEQWENELTFDRLRALSDSARELPPTHVSAYAAAISLGAMKPPKDREGTKTSSPSKGAASGVLPNGLTQADPMFLGLFGSDGNLL